MTLERSGTKNKAVTVTLTQVPSTQEVCHLKFCLLNVRWIGSNLELAVLESFCLMEFSEILVMNTFAGGFCATARYWPRLTCQEPFKVTVKEYGLTPALAEPLGITVAAAKRN